MRDGKREGGNLDFPGGRNREKWEEGLKLGVKGRYR